MSFSSINVGGNCIFWSVLTVLVIGFSIDSNNLYGTKVNDFEDENSVILSSGLKRDSLFLRIQELFTARSDEIVEYYNFCEDSYLSNGKVNNLLFLNNEMGRYLISNEELDQAILFLKKNFNEDLSKTNSSKNLIDETKYLISKGYCEKFQPDSALYYSRQVLRFREENYGVDTLTAKANSLMGYIFVKNYLGVSGAQKYLLNSLDILKTIGNAPPALIIENYLNLMVAYSQIDGNHSLSEIYGKSTLDLIHRNGLANTLLHKRVLRNVGWIYNHQGDYENASKYLQKAYNIVDVKGGSESEANKALSLKAIGIAQLGLKKYDEAFQYFNDALYFTLQSHKRISSFVAVCYYYFGLTFLERYEFGEEKEEFILKKAIENFKISEEISNELKIVGLDKGRSRNYRRLAKTYYFLNEKDSSMKYLQKAIFLAKPFSNNYENPPMSHFLEMYTYFIALRYKCNYHREWYFKNPKDSLLSDVVLTNFLTIDSLINYHRNNDLSEKSHLYLNKKNLVYYEGALEVLYHKWMNEGESDYLKEQIFKFMENSKASLLVKSIKQSELYESIGVPDSLLEQIGAIKSRLAYLRNNENDISDKKGAEIGTEILETTNQLKSLTKLIKDDYLNGREHKENKFKPISLKDAVKYSTNRNKVIVEYFYGEKAIYGLSINGNKIRFYKTLRSDSLDSVIVSFKEEVVEGIPMDKIVERCNEFEDRAYLIYNQFLKKLVDSVKTADLLIIPDGKLSYLPFEALVTKKQAISHGQYNRLSYALKNFNISYSFSLSAQLAKQNLASSSVIKNPKVLAFGFSDKKVSQGEKSVKRESEYVELSGTLEEIESISESFSGSFYVGKKATEQVFKSNAHRYNILHLALHNVSDYQNPLNSKIIFRSEEDTIDDGELYIHELYKINMKPQLVVLSACESGVGKWNRGEGVYSLGRSLSNLGCRSVVMSLWQVDDKSTAKIMGDLYKKFQIGIGADESLRLSKLNFLSKSDGLMAHPSNWAGFIYNGETVSIEQKTFILHRILGIGLFLFLIILILLKNRIGI